MMVPAFAGNVGFNAQHSPMGAYFSFTCGHFGTRGGMGVEMGKPAEQDIFVGYKEGGRYADVPLVVLPFFDGADKLDPAAAFLAGGAGREGEDRQRFAPVGAGEMERMYGWGTDRWRVKGGLEFSIYTPFGEIPEPPPHGVGGEEELRAALCPAVAAEVRVDNRGGMGVRTGFFAINFREGGVRILELEGGRKGIGFRRELGFGVEVVEVGEDLRCAGKVGEAGGAFAFIKWWPHEGLEDRSNAVHLLGTCGGFGFEVPAGKHYALRVVLGCHVEGVVTTGLAGRYFYNRYFARVEEVLSYAGPRFSRFKKAAAALDKQLVGSGLSADQQFLVAHGTRSYYGNTQLLEVGGEPYWVVNEGEYRMMNTLDLAADQVFWELGKNPWVVRNVLDNFVRRYSYFDEVKTTENTEGTEGARGETRAGGISFCHDQGTHNQFSPLGRSAYEQANLTGCFSYMTQEELCNWILMAASYVAKTGDQGWAANNAETLRSALASMKARAPIGVMEFDSALCKSGSEITTYDSLDASLGQARQNLYLAVKCWAAYEGICLVFEMLDRTYGSEHYLAAWDSASECAMNVARILSNLGLCEGALPAVFEKESPGYCTRILAAVEGLAFPSFWEFVRDKRLFPDNAADLPVKFLNSSYAEGHAVPKMLNALRAHTTALLSDPQRRNRFADGGVKLSSTSENSWLSKIAIVQHVGRAVFNLDERGAVRKSGGATGWEEADAAHVRWLTTGAGAYWCACDQIVKGEARGSKYYPRLVTTALWLRER
ncbi:MAG TPA: glycoside hydrolase family 52 protein [Phycisphaerae bacterium]|nr:glycoside hydrolase family 52 protein [Phycisphaerae bacterium]